MTDRTKQLSFVADEETLALIGALKVDLKAPTTAAVFRKALALAKVAAEQARQSDGIVTVRGKGQPATEEIAVALRA
ncbi:hypothetical protein SAMN02799625_04687 [Methylobacterium sp. UNC300MFChir4.1]|uniref:hypothetical protein n=1 Tax=Methylobacterium sp. UNC300MFChir4.1 TaxID=1502747 RepID=UPI0008D3A51F|nr:hypothetical protein [Methylobacterium sp. UNC300MFChir4.1]SEP10290.1 hypothetical protein SAMN02799625_04687 [Methylobacterium sp. UNC300MFChir4.1]